MRFRHRLKPRLRLTHVWGSAYFNPPATHFSVSAASPQTAGTAFSFTVTALTAANATATGYAGTVHYTSSDGSATLPANATLVSGVGTLSATLKTAGTQTLTATDTVTGSITGVSGNITVNAAVSGLLDHFIDTNGTNLTAHTMNTGPGWTALLGTWTIQGNKAIKSVTANTNFNDFISSDSGLSDCTVQVNIVLQNYEGICLRASDADNLITCYINAVECTVQTISSGGYSTVGTAVVSLANGNTYVLKAVLLGTSIKVYIDNVLQLDLTSSFNQSVTKHGMMSGTGDNTATFDDFSVA